MPEIPAYKLPLLAQDLIVGFLDLQHLIKGCLVSPYFKTLVKRAHVKIDNAYWKEPDYSFSMNSGNSELTIRFRWVGLHYFYQQEMQRYQRFNGSLYMKLSVGEISICNSNPHHSRLEDWQFIIDSIFETFNVDTFWAGYRISKNILFPVAYRYRHMVRVMYLTQCSYDNSCPPLTSQELSQFLNDMRLESLQLQWRIVPGTRFPKPLTATCLKFSAAACFTIDDLLTIDCRKLKAYGITLTAHELKRFILEWQKGGFAKLEEIEFFGSDTNWSTVLDGIATVEAQPVVPERSNWPVEIRREVHRSDGKKALVECNRQRFEFTVLN